MVSSHRGAVDVVKESQRLSPPADRGRIAALLGAARDDHPVQRRQPASKSLHGTASHSSPLLSFLLSFPGKGDTHSPQVVGPSAHQVAQVDDEAVLHEGHVHPARRILVLGDLQTGPVALRNRNTATTFMSRPTSMHGDTETLRMVMVP